MRGYPESRENSPLGFPVMVLSIGEALRSVLSPRGIPLRVYLLGRAIFNLWITLGILSSLFLGLYDVGKKHALRENAVIPVLFLSSVFALAWMIPPVVLSVLWNPPGAGNTAWPCPCSDSGTRRPSF